MQLILSSLLVGVINGAFYAVLSLGLSITFGVLRIANFAAAWDIPCIPHFFGPGLRFAATIQLLAAISNAELCEYPTTTNPLRFELMDQPLAAEKGVVSLPTGPGLGVSLNEKTLARYRID